MPTHTYPTCKSARHVPNAVLVGLQRKQQIVVQVIEGKLDLWEAGRQFQVAHQAASACLESATGVPNRTIDNESACRALIGWVCLALSDRPEQADRVSTRLEGELRDCLRTSAQCMVPPR